METRPAGWLLSHGPMAEQIRAYDWAATTLGPIERWPTSLRTVVTMMLDHPLPMMLGWGSEMVSLYNDAYCPLLGRQVNVLGRPLLDVWNEARVVAAPQITQALAGSACYFCNARFMLLRGGQAEEAFFDYTYSPVRDETGAVLGVLNTSIEVTHHVVISRKEADAAKALRDSEGRLRALVTASSFLVYNMSPDWRAMYQLDSDTLAKTTGTIGDWTDKYIPDEDRAEVYRTIERAIQSKSPFELEHRVRLADGQVGWVLSRAVPILNEDGLIVEWFGTGSDVTARKRMEEALRESEARLRIALEGVGEALYALDRDWKFLFASRAALKIWKKELPDILGKTLIEAFPGIETSEPYEAHVRVMNSRSPERLEEKSPVLQRWIELDVAPTAEGGISVCFRDIEERKIAADAVSSELRNTKILQELSARHVTEENIQAVYEDVLSAAIAITGAKAGTVQILEDESEELTLIATRGFSRTMTEYFRTVQATSNTPCGCALRSGTRSYFDFDPASVDVEVRMHVDDGVLSAQSSPLRSRSGTPIGMVSTHWGAPGHRLSEGELRFLDLLIRQAADLIEQRRTAVALRESELRYHVLFSGSPAPFLILRPDTPRFTIVEVNDAYLAATARTREGIIGRGVFEAFPDNPADTSFSSVDMLRPSFERVLASRRPDSLSGLRYDLARTDGTFEERWWSPVNSPLLDEDGKVEAIIHNANDVTEEYLATAALRESEERQAFLLRLNDELRSLTDPDEIQEAHAKLLGDRLEAGWCYYNEFDETGTIATVSCEFARPGLPTLVGVHDLSGEPNFTGLVRSGEMFNVPNLATSSLFTVQAKANYSAMGMQSAVGAPLVRDGRLIAVLLVADTHTRVWTESEIILVREVAERTWMTIERVRAEAARRESEQNLRGVANVIADLLWYSNPDGWSPWYNERWLQYTGQSLEQARGWGWVEAIHPDDREGSSQRYRLAVEQGKALQQEHRIRRHTGEYRWFLVRSEPLMDSRGRVTRMYGAATDMQDQRLAMDALRRSEERFRLFVENVREYALVQTDFEGIITSWNPGAERLFGYSSAEVVGKPFSMLVPEKDRHSGIIAREMAALSRGQRSSDAHFMERKGGSTFFAEWVTEPVLDDQGKLRGTAKVMRDETERQRAEMELRASLTEKEQLLKEVHHRVKNNLQVIVSLLNMQSHQIPDEAVLSQFQEARNRVLAISSIHELLYRAESFAGIVLTDYVRQLVPGLITFYGLGSQVTSKIEGDGNTLELERAVPFGMLLNELASNACKHAFPAPRNGTICVSVEPEGTDLVLTVTDDGKGLPEGFQYQKATSLGLKLVHALARQLRGTVEVSSEQGTTFRVRFPATTVEASA